MSCSRPSRVRQKLVLVTLLVCAGALPAQADCPARIGQLQALLKAGDIERAVPVLDEIKNDGSCDRYQVKSAKKIMVTALLLEAAKLWGRPDQQARYAGLVRSAAAQNVSYGASWRLGDIERDARNYKAAADAYQKAVELLGEDIAERQSKNLKVDDLIARGRDLVQQAAEVRLLAATEAQPQFVAALVDHRGALGGAYNTVFNTVVDTTRGIQVEKIATPVTFEYDSASLTSVGAAAAQELVDLLAERRPGRVSIIGHTDQKGSDEYNLGLSRRRAETVAAFLKTKGIDAAFATEGKGKSQPRQLSKNTYSPEEIDRLNRRVEVTWDH